MRVGLALMLAAATLGACGSREGAGNASNPNAAPAVGGVDEDRQVLVDLAKRACTERADLQPNVETATAQRGCDCAIDKLYAGKSADEMMEARRQPGTGELEDRTARECLANGR